MNRIVGISVCIAAFGLMAGTAFAEAEEGWSFKVEPLFLTAYGNEGIVAISEFSGGPSTQEIREVEYDGGTGFAVGFEQRGGTWGWGVDIWGFDTDGTATTGQVTSDFANSISRSVSNFWTGRSAPDVGTGFVEARTVEEVETTNIDIYAVRTIAEHNKSRVDVRFGINATNFEQGQVATILDDSGIDSISRGGRDRHALRPDGRAGDPGRRRTPPRRGCAEPRRSSPATRTSRTPSRSRRPPASASATSTSLARSRCRCRS